MAWRLEAMPSEFSKKDQVFNNAWQDLWVARAADTSHINEEADNQKKRRNKVIALNKNNRWNVSIELLSPCSDPFSFRQSKNIYK